MYDVKTLYKAASVQDALSHLQDQPEALVVNGGTDVMIRLRERKLKEASLISIMGIDGLKGIALGENDDIIIGAGACFNDICKSDIIGKRVPALVRACNQVGSPQIRYVATIGGNICNGAVSADSVPALLVYEARLILESLAGIRAVPLESFHMGPGKVAFDRQREILTTIVIPAEAYKGYSADYIKFGQRNAMEIATLSCAASLCLSPDKAHVGNIRLAFGVAAEKPLRCYKTEAALAGRLPDADFFALLRKTALSELNPRESWRASKELRVQLIKTLATRAVENAYRTAGGRYDA